MRVPIPFVGASYEAESLPWDAQRTINLYPRVSESNQAKSVTALLGTPGLLVHTTLPQSPLRGRRVVAGRLFVVAGNGLYEVTGAAAYTLLGSFGSSSGKVGMTDDGDELVIGDGTGFFVYNLQAGTFAPVTGAPVGTHCDVVDSVVICVEDGSQRLWYSEPTIASTIDGLNFVVAESAPDDLVTVKVDHGEILAFGETTVEFLSYTGGSDDAIQRVNNAIVEHGCAAAFSVAKFDNTLAWIGKGTDGEGIVWKLQGASQPVRLSTAAVEDALKGSSDLSQAVAWTYQDGGSWFYVLNAPGLETTWVYDALSGQWHERAYLKLGAFERHRADGHVFWNGSHLVFDHESGKIYTLSRDYHDDDGSPRRAVRRTGYTHDSGNRVFFSRLYVDMETGVGLNGTGQGSDPVAMLRWSDDGGRTWSNEVEASIGRIGQYQVRAVWTRLGSSRQRMFELAISDPVKLTIMAAHADIQVGAN